jgi:hypothetical protein
MCTMNTPYKYKECKLCNHFFKPVWDDQEYCTECKKLRCDPYKIELYRSIARKVWHQVRL